MSITTNRLNEAFATFKSRYGGNKEDYFPPLFISDKFGKPTEAVLDHCAFGPRGGGIDAYYIDKEAKNLYLYQFKWSDNHELFKDAYRQLIKDGIENIFSDRPAEAGDPPLIAKIKLDLEEFKDLINKVYVCFVFNGEPEHAEGSRVLESFREELESKKHFIDSYFHNNEITLTIQYISNETKKINQTSRTKKTFQYNISFKAPLSKQASGNEVLRVGLISLFDLYTMFVDMKQRLFEKNIRAGLQDDLAPNQAIKKSLKDIVVNKKLSPEYFTFHHNGVTLFAEKIEGANDTTTIVEPRVLNGAQTITTLWRFIEDIRKLPQYAEYEATLRKIEVIGKIITQCSQEFVTQVTISNNKQNPVESWNLRANDLIQLEFEDKFRKEGLFYERQENAFANLSDTDLEELGIEHNKELKIRKLAQTFLAIQGEIDKVAEIGKVFETDSLYEKTFQPAFLKSDTRKIITAYKVQFRLNAIIREIESRGENKYFFVRYARNLVWALTVQGLLNEKNQEQLLANFGTSLSIETDFNTIIKEIGSKKIRIILSALIQQPKYQGYMENGKFSFLKTRVAFSDCMAIAEEKYGWETIRIWQSNR
ncbi:MAG TPA: hypothetical protein DCE81_01115, partial [Cytophagales bacterium]|nr:hypothetical protein [Cytophagales bacterium]